MVLTKLLYCVTVAFTMTEQADQLHHDNAPAHSTALMQAFLAKHHITQVCQYPYSPDLSPCDFWPFRNLQSLLKVRRFLNAAVTQYTSSVTGISLPND
jgi:histone-lysine N-methyltransferase SETMAR